MATIISSRLDVDRISYDYIVKMTNGQMRTLHSQGGRPKDEKTWADAVEAALLAAEAAAAAEAAKPSELDVLRAENVALKDELAALKAK